MSEFLLLMYSFLHLKGLTARKKFAESNGYAHSDK